MNSVRKNHLSGSRILQASLGAGLVAGAAVLSAGTGFAATSQLRENPTAVSRPAEKPSGSFQLAGCTAAKACNPCAAKKCNPCAAKKCNPCAAKKSCNPCAAKNPNPCAAKKCNPCAASKS